MYKEIFWDIDKMFCDYPPQIKNIYKIKYLNLRKSFSEWQGKICFDFKDNISLWSSITFSRNTYFSKIYHYICVIESLKKLEKKNIIIKTESKYFSEILTNFFKKNIKVLLKKQIYNNKFSKIYYLKNIIFQSIIFFVVNIFFQKKKIKKRTLIHTYPSYSLEKYEKLFQFKINSGNRSKFYFVPTFIITKKIILVLRLLFKLNNSNYIFKEHYYSFRDLLKIFFSFKEINDIKIKFRKFKNIDYSKIIQEELNDFKHYDSLIYSKLNILFVKNLAKQNVKVKKVICWYENQEQRGWNYGFRKYFSNIENFGYQGFGALPCLLNTIPTRFEEKLKIIPRDVILISSVYKKNLHEFTNKNFFVGPPLIFKDIFKKFKKKYNITFLVVLNEFKNVNRELINWIKSAEKNIDVNIYIKKPKYLNIDDLIKECVNYKNIIFTDENLVKLLKKTKFVITSGLGLSSVPLEALAYGCKILAPTIEPLDQEYFNFLDINQKYYKVFSNKQKFNNFLKKNNNSKKNIVDLKQMYKFQKRYFSRTNEKIFY